MPRKVVVATGGATSTNVLDGVAFSPGYRLCSMEVRVADVGQQLDPRLNDWRSRTWHATFITLAIVAFSALVIFTIMLLEGDIKARAALWIGWPSAIAAVIIRTQRGPSPLVKWPA